MTATDFGADLKKTFDTLEKYSKRLRKVEILARASRSVGSFIALSDTPDTYAGFAGRTVVINTAEDALYFGPFSSSCVTFECGLVGWRATGGTDSRVLVHEIAFQLSTDGNPRGSYAIDLQRYRFADDEVAGSYGSAIFSNEWNKIGGTGAGGGAGEYDCEWSTITGAYNTIDDNASYCHILGNFNAIYEDCYDVVACGWSHDLNLAQYILCAYDDNVVEDALGCFLLGENNTLLATGLGDYPTYTGMFGTGNFQEGDVWYCFQFGDDHVADGDSIWGIWIGMQGGYDTYMQDVNMNFLFGNSLKSYCPVLAEYYDGRMVLGESGVGGVTTDGTGHSGGFHQASWFSQNWVINTWYVAWTTAYQYPIIADSAWGFKAYISETTINCGEIGLWKIEGLIKNAGGTTTLVWSSVTPLHRDNANREWQAAADNVNDRLIFQFRDLTGPDATTDHNTQIRVDTEEVGFE
jgi:hypothetical protein